MDETISIYNEVFMRYNPFRDYVPQIIKVSKENVSKILYENIVAFTFAYPGAQGINGELFVLHKTTELKFYFINRYFHADEELVKIVDNTYFKPFADDMIKNNGFIHEIHGWKKMCLFGQGNLTFIREEYYEEFKKLNQKCFNANNKKLKELAGYSNRHTILNILFNKDYINLKQDIINNKFK